jgi:uncharacterized protein (TIGR03000 family)
MRKILLAVAFGAVALLGFPGMSSAQHGGGGHGGGGHGGGGHGGGGGWGGGRGGGWGGGRGYYGRGYYGSGFGLYLGSPYYYGYGSPYYGSYYDYGPSTYIIERSSSYVDPSYSYAPPASENPNAVMLEVRVPENAQVWVAGDKTNQTGAVRHFVSPPLEAGTYTYEIRARWTDATGKSVERTKTLDVQAGSRLGVDFNKT